MPIMGWGDRIRAWFGRDTPVPAPTMSARFANPVYPVDQLSIMLALRSKKIDRKAALEVPAVLRGRNMICSISTLPLQLTDATNNVVDHPLFRQVDPNITNVAMLAMTIEDLLFDGIAWWKITRFTADRYPAAATRYAPQTVSLQPPDDYRRGYLPSGEPTEGVVWIDGHPVPHRQVIRFDSPNPPLLDAAGRAISRAIELDEAADMYATNRRMRGFFAPADATVDPAPDEEIQTMLDKFAGAREKRLDGYVPAALTYTPIQDPTPAELQIIAQQQRVDLQLANALGIDPEDLGINVTSRTYQNATDRRQDRINDTLSTYMRAITDRLSMPDVTRRGYTARFWLNDYLRADPKTRAEVQQTYHDIGVIDSADIQKAEGLPPKQIATPAPPGPAAPASQISVIPAAAR